MAFWAALLVARTRQDRRPRPTFPNAVALVFVVTASLSTLQFVFPSILTALRRDRHLLAAGQWWRLVTPLFVQDGGWVGTVFNLVVLLLVGVPAARLLGWRRWLILYFGTGIASEIVAYAWLRQGFAGNSTANFGVAAGLLVLALRTPDTASRVMGGIGLVAGLLLLTLGNLHGAALLIGILIALGLESCSGSRGRRAPSIEA